MLVVGYILTAIVAYLLGSIPTGYLVSKSRGIDIRKVGSGNIGATNVFRTLGKPAGTFVLLIDALKGFLACAVVAWLAQRIFARHATFHEREYFVIVGGMAAVLGHNYTCWLNFKGGKGIATSAGVVLALFWWAALVVIPIFITVAFISRYVSLASIASAFWLPILVWLFNYSGPRVAIATLMAVLAIFKHKANIQRLIKGTEHRIGEKKNIAPVDAAVEAQQ